MRKAASVAFNQHHHRQCRCSRCAMTSLAKAHTCFGSDPPWVCLQNTAHVPMTCLHAAAYSHHDHARMPLCPWPAFMLCCRECGRRDHSYARVSTCCPPTPTSPRCNMPCWELHFFMWYGLCILTASFCRYRLYASLKSGLKMSDLDTMLSRNVEERPRLRRRGLYRSSTHTRGIDQTNRVHGTRAAHVLLVQAAHACHACSSTCHPYDSPHGLARLHVNDRQPPDVASKHEVGRCAHRRVLVNHNRGRRHVLGDLVGHASLHLPPSDLDDVLHGPEAMEHAHVSSSGPGEGQTKHILVPIACRRGRYFMMGHPGAAWTARAMKRACLDTVSANTAWGLQDDRLSSHTAIDAQFKGYELYPMPDIWIYTG